MDRSLTSDPRRISELTVATAELRFKFACCIYRDENGVHCTSFQKPCSKAIDGFFRLILWVPLVYAVHHRLSRNDLIRSRPEFLKRSHNTQEQSWERMRSTAKNKMVSFAKRLPPSAARKNAPELGGEELSARPWKSRKIRKIKDSGCRSIRQGKRHFPCLIDLQPESLIFLIFLRLTMLPFPHPASSNRMGGFPASGSRRKVHDVAHGRWRGRLLRRTRPSTLCREALENRLVPDITLCLAHNH